MAIILRITGEVLTTPGSDTTKHTKLQDVQDFMLKLLLLHSAMTNQTLRPWYSTKFSQVLRCPPELDLKGSGLRPEVLPT
jgi:hypothetical protein